VIERLSCLIPKIKDVLVQAAPAPIYCVYDSSQTVPFGSERLRAVELLQEIVKLNKEATFMAVIET